MIDINIVLLRHGETLFNSEQKVQGWSDSFLTPNGRLGVKGKAIDFLVKGLYFDAIYSSDSGRTLETSRIISSILKVPSSNIILEPDLREYNYGIFEGQTNMAMETAIKAEIFEKNNDGFKARAMKKDPTVIFDVLNQLDKDQKPTPNTWYSETTEDYLSRVKRGLMTIIADSIKQDNSLILLVSHGHTIATLMGLLFPTELTQWLNSGKKLDNCGDLSLTYNVIQKEFHFEGIHNPEASQKAIS